MCWSGQNVHVTQREERWHRLSFEHRGTLLPLLFWPPWWKKDLAEFEQVGSWIFKTHVMQSPSTSSRHLLNSTTTMSHRFWDVNHLILASLPLPLPTIIPRMLHEQCGLPAILTLCTASLLCAFQKASTMGADGEGENTLLIHPIPYTFSIALKYSWRP